jgi:hypothetical protein
MKQKALRIIRNLAAHPNFMIRPLLCSLVLFPICLFSQVLNFKQDKAVKKIIAHQFGEDLANGLNLSGGRLNFQVLDQDTLFNPSGFNYVFQLKADSLIRLDHSIFHGANNNRFLFCYNHTLFALGGYGLFTTNNNLLSFNLKLKEWCFVDCKGEVPPFILGSAYKNGKFVYSFNNVKAGNNVKADLLDSNAYRLDLETKEWQRVTSGFLKKHPPTKVGSYNARDYLVLVYNVSTVIIEVNSDKFIQINNEDFGFGYSNALKKIDGNCLYFEPYNQFQKEPTELNIDKIWQKNLARIQRINWEVQGGKNTVTQQLILLITAFSLILGLYFLFQLKKQKRLLANASLAEANELIDSPLITKALYENDKDIQQQLAKRLLDASKTELTIEEIDDLLEISHLIGDSRKLRRHRILKTFPDGAISRNKSNIDRRSFTYTLDKELIEKWLNEGLTNFV